MINSKKLIKIFKKKKLTLAVAESCTGGLFSKVITSQNNASKIFSMGLITYSNQAKMKILKVKKNIIRKHGAVSHECCQAMVKNLSNISNSNVCVAITGIAGPKGASKNKPIGLVFIGIKYKKKYIFIKCLFKNNGRVYIQKQTVKKILDLLIRLTKQDN